MLLQVQRSGDSGSPRDKGSTSCSRASTTAGSIVVIFLRPAPDRRMWPGSMLPPPPASSCLPRVIVVRAIPVIRDTVDTPPRPRAAASEAAKRRSDRSSSVGASCRNRKRILSSVFTREVYHIRRICVAFILCRRLSCTPPRVCYPQRAVWRRLLGNPRRLVPPAFRARGIQIDDILLLVSGAGDGRSDDSVATLSGRCPRVRMTSA
jgi:hypothetical protein